MTRRKILNEHELTVYLNDTLVGTITLLPTDVSVFAFDESYIENHQRPTLSLSFKSKTGQLITKIKPRRTKIEPFFSNLLPEGHLRDYLSEKVGVKKDREFYLLSALRTDLPGAVRVEANSDLIPTDAEDRKLDYNDGPFSFSLAGVQLKFSALREAKGGLTISASGSGGDWIIKLPSASFDSLPEAEYSMMTLAGLSGIEIPEVKLVETAEIKGLPQDLPPAFGPSLAIKRYDRGDGGKRIHAEDFAQVFSLYPLDKYGKASYENIASVLWAESGGHDLKQFVRRVVFSVMIGNADMHVKNFSVIYHDGRIPQLSPAYDLVPTILYLWTDTNLGLSLGQTKKMHSIDSDTLRKFAARAKVPEAMVLKEAKDGVNATLEAWHQNKLELPISRRQIDTIENHMKSLPLTAEMAPSQIPKMPQKPVEKLPPNYFIRGDVELDQAVPPGMVSFKAMSGERFDMDAPTRMIPWVVSEQVHKLAKRHPSLANTSIIAYVGPLLYDEWRKENYVRFDQRVLKFSLSPSDLDSDTIQIQGPIWQTRLQKLEKLTETDEAAIFDVVFENGELWSFEGKVLKLMANEETNKVRVHSTVTLSVSKPKFIFETP